MAKDKLLAEWFWTDRWMGSSAFGLPIAARGLYREMLTQAWLRGAKLPNDHDQIRRVVAATKAEWRKLWPRIERFWRVEGDSLVNDTQLAVYAEAKGRSDRASKRGLSGAQALHKQSTSTAQALASDLRSPISDLRPKKELSSADADFEAFRDAYPKGRRVGGKLARSAFERAVIGCSGSLLRTSQLAVMLVALEQHKRSEQWQTPKLIPLMTTWLNQERWLQVLPEPPQEREYEPWICRHEPRCPHRAACAIVSARTA